MKTEKIITLELAARGAAVHIGEAAVAGDYGTRTLKFALTENGKPWTVPDTIRASLAFRTEGGCSGEYDTMPDESSAFAIQGNLVTVRLIDQILKNPGWVRLILVLRRDLIEQISAFPVMMTVTEGMSGGKALPTEYYRVRDLAEVNDALAKIDRRLKEVDSSSTETVAAHNRSSSAHEDIRMQLDKLSTGKLDADRLEPALKKALIQAKESGDFDGYTPEDRAELEAWILEELAKRGQVEPLFAQSAQWLAQNGDKTKIYVLPDGILWAWMLTQVESGPAYDNLLDNAINADGTPYVGTNGEKGYKVGWRLNSSRVEKEAEGCCCTGFIAVKSTDVVRIKNITANSAGNGYIHFYGADFTTNTGITYEPGWLGKTEFSFVPNDVTALDVSSANATADTAYMRLSTGVITDATIITINEEITEVSGTTVETYAWANTGMAFVPADYEPRIIALEEQTAQNTADIAALKNGAVDTGGVDALTWIRNWDAPIYDANIPTFRLSAEKAAMTDATQTPDALYAMYDALMARYPHYITKTDLGLCSDGVNHVYRYDFKDPDQRRENARVSEVKTKAIICSGIHREWAGIFGLYYALEEITTNPDLRDLRRNVHLIVVPCVSPYTTLAEYAEQHGGQQNANGVEVHKNFEVAFQYPDSEYYTPPGELHHGGTEPLSEPETQYLDAIMRENTDAAFFLTCHNFNLDYYSGISFLWPSVATAYMCNMGYRLIDRMSQDWMDRFEDELAPGIASYRTENLADWDTRLGHAQISANFGTETRQATKYGIQAANVEICDRFWVHGIPENQEPTLSAFTMSRGAETIVNFILMCFGTYDYKDKREYYIP